MNKQKIFTAVLISSALSYLLIFKCGNAIDRDKGFNPVFENYGRLERMSTKDFTAISAALLAIQGINGRLANSSCSQLQLRMVTSATKKAIKRADLVSVEHLVVSFITLPGSYRFEMEVNYFGGNKSFSEVSELQRTSRLKKEFSKCNTNPGLELFCYCE